MAKLRGKEPSPSKLIFGGNWDQAEDDNKNIRQLVGNKLVNSMKKQSKNERKDVQKQLMDSIEQHKINQGWSQSVEPWEKNEKVESTNEAEMDDLTNPLKGWKL